MDATIIAAPSSTKNATEARDPEMKQTRKGNNWHFGMKLHIGTDPRGSSTVVATQAATWPTSRSFPTCCMDKSARSSAIKPTGASSTASVPRNRACTTGSIGGAPGSSRYAGQRASNRRRSQARARGEHAFHVVKRLWGFTKVRYRGLAKNIARLLAVFALANLYLLRRRLAPEVCAA